MAYTIEELRKRHSVRSFADRQLPDEVAVALQAEVKEINDKYPTIRFELRLDEPQVFTDFKKTYGMFSGVRHYL
ncbi:MAG: nitroreductase, partial [Muribaculaceae bacterium]|nr:nitroreductase [Muribaculaceae bacterium]